MVAQEVGLVVDMEKSEAKGSGEKGLGVRRSCWKYD